MQRSVVEIKIRCRSILDQPDIVSLVMQSSSPTAAYAMVFTSTRDVETAKAARWLAVLRRDHQRDYSELIAESLGQAKVGTAEKGEGSEKGALRA